MLRVKSSGCLSFETLVKVVVREGSTREVLEALGAQLLTEHLRGARSAESAVTVCGTEVLSLRIDRHLWRERVACTACASCVLFPSSLSCREFVVCTIMHGSCVAHVNKRLTICLGVSCKSAMFVLSLHSYTVSPVARTSSWLVYSYPAVSQSRKGIVIYDPQP